MPNLGPTELIIILVIVIAIFGAGKLADIGGALGKGVKEFREASKEIEGAKEDVAAVSKDVKTAAQPKKEEKEAQQA